MNSLKLPEMTVGQLVERFVSIALAQNEALLMNENTKFNRLFEQMEAVKQELKFREGDQRRELLRLLDHPNAQVRLKAAKATLAIAPDVARDLLQKIADSKEYPQAGEAGMSIWALDEGIFKPT